MNEWDTLRKRLYQTFDGADMRTRIKLTFEDGRNMMVVIEPGALAVTDDSTGDAACEFKATLAHALAIFNRKLSAPKAMVTGKLKVSGDLGLALKVSELLNVSGQMPPGATCDEYLFALVAAPFLLVGLRLKRITLVARAVCRMCESV